MSVHSDLIAGVGTPLLLDTHGETASVQLKSDDAAVELTALVNRERTIQKLTPEGRKIVKQRRFTFITDEASRFGGLANLPMNATLTYAGIEYAVAEKPAVLNGTISVIGERSEQKRGGGRDYRKA